MPEPVIISIQVDDSGVAAGVDKTRKAVIGLGADAASAGAKGAAGFAQMGEGSKVAFYQVQALGYELGVRMPRFLEQIISKTVGSNAAFGLLFKGIGVAGAVVALGQIITNMDKVRESAFNLAQGVRDAFEQSVDVVKNSDNRLQGAFANIAKGLNAVSGGLVTEATGFSTDGYPNGAPSSLLSPNTPIHNQKEIDAAEADLKSVQQETDAALVRANTAAKSGYAAIAAADETATAQILQHRLEMFDKTSKLAESGGDNEKRARLQMLAADDLFNQQDLSIHQAAAAERAKLFRTNADAIKDIQLKTAQVGLQGISLIYAQEADETEKVGRKLRDSELTRAQASKELAAIGADAAAKVSQEVRKYTDETSKFVLDATSKTAQGAALIEQRAAIALANIAKEVKDLTGGLSANDPAVAAIIEQGEQRKNAIVQQKAEELFRYQETQADATVTLQEQAAEASTAPWLRAYAGIENADKKLHRDLGRQLQLGAIDYETYSKHIQAADLDMNAKIADNFRETRDKIAGQLQTFADAIFGGHFLSYMLKQFEAFGLKMVATWLLTLTQMRGAAAVFGGSNSGSSIFGSLFGGLGKLLGINGGGGGGGSTASTSGGTTLFGGDSGSFGGGGLFAGPAALAGGGLVGGGFDSILAQSANQTLASGTAGAAASQLSQTTLFSGLLGKLFPHDIGLGKLGTLSGAQVGALGAGIGLESLLGAYKTGNLALGGLGGAAGGGLLGFELLASTVGGPFGALIGAGVGAVAGIISAIFGGRAQRSKAEGLLHKTYEPQLTAIEDQYKTHQITLDSAYASFDQLDATAKAGFGPLGDYGQHRLKILEGEINDAKATLGGYDKTRTRLGADVFGQGEFDSGGLVTPGRALSVGPTGTAHITAKLNEFVVNPSATAQNLPILDFMNRGGKVTGGGSGHTFQIIAWDGDSVDRWLSNGGARKLALAAQGARMEDAAGFAF